MTPTLLARTPSGRGRAARPDHWRWGGDGALRVHARQPRREQAGAPAHRGRRGHWRGMCCPGHARIGWLRRRRRWWVGVPRHCQSAHGLTAAGRECSGRGGSWLDVSLSGRWHRNARMAEFSGRWVTGRKGAGGGERAAELSGHDICAEAGRKSGSGCAAEAWVLGCGIAGAGGQRRRA